MAAGWARILSLDVLPWMILFLPLAGFIVLSLLGDRIRRDREETGAGVMACAVVALSLGCVIWTALHLTAQGVEMERYRQRLQAGFGSAPPPEPGGPYLPYQPYLFGQSGFDWIGAGPIRVPFALLLDPLSIVMMLVVTGVGLLIHVYSLGYMAADEDRVRYFSYLNLFVFFMLLLVGAANLPLMFVGWEGVGLCSYLLIGFSFKRQSATDAGMKAFIVNRVGDAGLLLGIILAFYAFGTFDFLQITEAVAAKPEGAPIVTAVCLLLFFGACGKSAQIPLHIWLPDAMEGPTPVSALIHAATMVTAGVYMVTRVSTLYGSSETARLVVAAIGAVTALMAASVALVQTDIKRVLAYSTISQLGFMFLACGVAAFGVGIFHLFTHAFFKALLFLGAGSVLQALAGEQDMRRMGGLARKMPWTFVTFLIGMLAISGIPPLSGFFSKDLILVETYRSGRTSLFAIALLTAFLTALYMTRLLLLTFFGAYRGGERHIHEAPWIMRVPLLLLAAGAAVAGVVKIPQLLQPVVRLVVVPGRPAPEWIPYLAIGVVVIGIVSACYLYLLYDDLPGRIRAGLPVVQRVLEAKYGFDDVGRFLARRLVVEGSTTVLWKRLDAGLIDGAVDGTAWLLGALGRAVRLTQTGLVRAYLLVILGGAVLLLASLMWFR